MTDMNREMLARGWRAGPDETVILRYQVNDHKLDDGSTWVENDVSIDILLKDALYPDPDSEGWSDTFSKLRAWLSGTDSSEVLASGAQGGKKEKPLRFRWVGGCLFAATRKLNFFVDNILSGHQEIVAKEMEIKMAARIALTLAVTPAIEASTPSRNQRKKMTL